MEMNILYHLSTEEEDKLVLSSVHYELGDGWQG